MIVAVKSTATRAKMRKGSALRRDRNHSIEEIWQELGKVRAALEESEQRCARLAERVEELEAENEKLRRKRWATEELLQKKIKKLEKDVADRDKKLEQKNKQLAWLRKNKFGKSSEKSKGEPLADSEDKDELKRKRGQQPGSKGHGPTDRSNVRVDDTVTLEIPGGCKCPECGVSYRILSRTQDTGLFEIAVDLFQTIFKQLKYVSQCDCLGKKIVTAAPPPKLYPRTSIGNSLWVFLVVQKFLHGVPTNRTLKDLSLYGFSLAEGTVTGGLERINDLLTALHDEIVNHCRGGDLWNADETSWRVFDAGKTKWWMWLIASDDAVAYVLDPSRSKKVPTEFFAASEGILMTDRFASYKSLHEGIRKAWCWVHQRRDILNILNGMKTLKNWSTRWLKMIGELFGLNHKRFRLWEQNRDKGPKWDEAVTALEQHVQKLKELWEKELKLPQLHDEQKKVLRSLKKHWEGLTLFLEDPRIPLHNNRAERLLRNAVILRKNSFGSGTEWAGQLAAKLFGLFQTWLINGIDPQALLLDYFNECSKSPGRAPPDVKEFMPWSMSAERKEQFKLPASYKRPG
ncbi:MAG TPA: IS66 family transposase [Planktothrix sp.]|jgi:transposase